MACDRFAVALKARALGVPLPSDAAAHLAVCSKCQAALAAEEQLFSIIDRALDDVGAVKATPDFVSRVRARVEDAPRWTPGGWWKPTVAVAAAAALVAMIVAGRVARNDSGVHDAAAPRPVQHAVESRAEPAPVAHAPMPAQTRAAAASPRAGLRMPVNTVRAARAPEVEVLVPRGQRQAVGRLFASLAGRPDVVSALLKFNGEGAVLGSTVTEPPELTIAPIRIEPVVVPAFPSSAPVLDK